MKVLRMFLLGGVCVASGCATTSPDNETRDTLANAHPQICLQTARFPVCVDKLSEPDGRLCWCSDPNRIWGQPYSLLGGDR